MFEYCSPANSYLSHHIKHFSLLQVLPRCPRRIKIVHDTLQDNDGEQRVGTAGICSETSVHVPEEGDQMSKRQES